VPLSACDRKSDEVLLIDGYNLIKTDPLLLRREHFGLEAARSTLEQRLHAYAQRTSAQLILFFDGDEGLPDHVAIRREGAMQIIFSQPPQKADDLLKQAIQQRYGAVRVRLISTDRDIRKCARQHRIRSTSSSQFLEELAQSGNWRAPKNSLPPPELDPLLNLDEDQIDLWERIFAQGRSEE